MKVKSLMLLTLALGCGLVAMIGVQQLVSGGKQAPTETLDVLVAVQEITPGVPLDQTMVAFKSLPKSMAPEGAVLEIKQFEGRALKVRAFPGDFILQAKLTEPGIFGASATIPKGMRVMSVPVDMTSSNSSMVQPGDRVDVLVTYKSTNKLGRPSSRTKTVLQRVEVFAIDKVRNAEEASTSNTVKNISLLLEPEQTQKLHLAKSMGTLQLSLRNIDDTDDPKLDDLDQATFDDVESAAGESSEDQNREDAVTAALDKKKDGPENVKEFLDEDQAEAEPAAVEEPAGPQWIITIYEGGTKVETALDLSGDGSQRSEPAKKGQAAEPAAKPKNKVQDKS